MTNSTKNIYPLFIDKIIKDFFKKQTKYVKIDGQSCEILGTIGTYHIVCDITNKNIKIGNKVEIEVNPKFVDSKIRREYR